MIIKPKGSAWTDYYFNKLIDLDNGVSLTLPESKEEVIKYLKFWNRTDANNSSTIDVIEYEKLIYFEEEYKDDPDIQLLVQILKEKIAYNYKIKALLIDNLVDPDIYNDKELEIIHSNWGKKIGVWEK